MVQCELKGYFEVMDQHQIPFGVLLRRWRQQRRMTQTDLALAAESSTRHLSCIETGKALPSREMVARLAECLDIPLRDRNTLLLTAGFAPAFPERSVTGLEAAKVAIDSVLRAHNPYPAFAVDRHWNVVLSNAVLPQLYEGCSAELMRKPVNAMRLILHPAGMGPRIVKLHCMARAHLGSTSPAVGGAGRSRHQGTARGSRWLSNAYQLRSEREVRGLAAPSYTTAHFDALRRRLVS